MLFLVGFPRLSDVNFCRYSYIFQSFLKVFPGCLKDICVGFPWLSEDISIDFPRLSDVFVGLPRFSKAICAGVLRFSEALFVR